jgi:hypothetical protein
MKSRDIKFFPLGFFLATFEILKIFKATEKWDDQSIDSLPLPPSVRTLVTTLGPS